MYKFENSVASLHPQIGDKSGMVFQVIGYAFSIHCIDTIQFIFDWKLHLKQLKYEVILQTPRNEQPKFEKLLEKYLSVWALYNTR